MKTIQKIGTALLAVLTFVPVYDSAEASTVASQWYFGSWACRIDGRPAKMRWRVVDDPQTTCAGGICTSTSGVKVVGHFSDNGGPWVPLKATASGSTTLSIRYLGAQQDNWFLRYSPNTRSASGWTTWQRRRFPLSCSDRR